MKPKNYKIMKYLILLLIITGCSCTPSKKIRDPKGIGDEGVAWYAKK